MGVIGVSLAKTHTFIATDTGKTWLFSLGSEGGYCFARMVEMGRGLSDSENSAQKHKKSSKMMTVPHKGRDYLLKSKK